MKKLACILLCGTLLCNLNGCANGGTFPQTTSAAPQGTAQIPNPIQVVEDASAFDRLGFAIEAPSDAEQVEYSMISDQVAQVRFRFQGLEYTFRAAKEVEEEALHGVYKTFDEEELGIEADGVGWYASVRIRTVEEGRDGALATWDYDPVNYSLWTGDNATAEQVGELAVSLAQSVFPQAATQQAQ